MNFLELHKQLFLAGLVSSQRETRQYVSAGVVFVNGQSIAEDYKWKGEAFTMQVGKTRRAVSENAIRLLRFEAQRAGDDEQVELCTKALQYPPDPEAMEACVKAIFDAKAQED